MKTKTEALLQASRDEMTQAKRNIGVAWRNIEEMKLILARAEHRANSSPNK